MVFNSLKSACEDPQGNVWVASNEGVTFDQRQVIYGPSEGLPNKISLSAYEDRRGQVWLGTYTTRFGYPTAVPSKRLPGVPDPSYWPAPSWSG